MSNQNNNDKWTIGEILIAIPIVFLVVVFCLGVFVLFLSGAAVAVFMLPIALVVATVIVAIKGEKQ